jgi:hypothetical protein
VAECARRGSSAHGLPAPPLSAQLPSQPLAVAPRLPLRLLHLDECGRSQSLPDTRSDDDGIPYTPNYLDDVEWRYGAAIVSLDTKGHDDLSYGPRHGRHRRRRISDRRGPYTYRRLPTGTERRSHCMTGSRCVIGAGSSTQSPEADGTPCSPSPGARCEGINRPG